MLDYLPIDQELMEDLEGVSDETLGRLVKAMTLYAFLGEEPDYSAPEFRDERSIWPFLRRRVNRIQAAHEKKASAGGKGGRAKQSEAEESRGKQSEAEESRTKQTEAEESRAKQNDHTKTNTNTETKTETDRDSVSVSVLPETDHTHKTVQQGIPGAGVRETPEGWYNPETPEAAADSAWLSSAPARRAIAQRILDYEIRQKRVDVNCMRADSGRIIGREIMEALCAAMMGGVRPGECQRLGDQARVLWAWEIILKEAALSAGTAPPAMAHDWREDVDELMEEAAEIAAETG